jgi:hypothetical protein
MTCNLADEKSYGTEIMYNMLKMVKDLEENKSAEENSQSILNDATKDKRLMML